MVLCTAGSKKAEFSPAGKIMCPSHCPSLFPLMFFFHYGITCNPRLMGPSTCFFFLAYPVQLALQTNRDLIYPLKLADAQWFFNLSPTEVPYPYSPVPREMCIPSFILTMCFLNPGVGVLTLDVFLTSLWAWPPHSQPWPRERRFWHTTRRTTPIRKQEGGNKAKETPPQLHLLFCGQEGRGPGSVLRKAGKDPCRWKPLGDCEPYSMPSLSVVLMSVSYIPFSLQRLGVSTLSLSTVSDTACT